MEKDLLLINKVKKYGDANSVQELIDRHSGIYIEMVNKYLPESMEGINKDDVLQDKDFCIYDAAIKFDKNKNDILRATNIGIIYQQDNLLPDFTAMENIYLASLAAVNNKDISISKA